MYPVRRGWASAGTVGAGSWRALPAQGPSGQGRRGAPVGAARVGTQRGQLGGRSAVLWGSEATFTNDERE
jgi:hypothetical protein